MLVVVKLFAAGKVWPSVQQHSTAAEDQLVQTLLVHLTVQNSRCLLDLNSKHYHTRPKNEAPALEETTADIHLSPNYNEYLISAGNSFKISNPIISPCIIS